MALVNGTNYDHIDLQAEAGGDVTRHKLQDTAGRALVAPTEDTSSASAAHEAGSYFILGGVLYRAVSPIAQGGGIVTGGAGRNCEAATVGEALSRLDARKADADGYYEGMTVGDAEQLAATVGVEDKTPYLFRASGGGADIGDREEDTLVGGTVAWNQLVGAASETVTVPSGHKYYASISGVKSIGTGAGTAISVTGGTDQVIDLTLLFGADIADYISALETASSGAGVSWFRSLFPKDDYAYDAGSLQSVQVSCHKTVGFNAYDPSTGKALVIGGSEYQITGAYTALSLNGETVTPADGKFTPAHSGELTVTGGDSATTCVHLRWDGQRDGEFEPYKEHAYALDGGLVLRGIPKLDSGNKLYCDGDTYESDGTVTRKFGTVTLKGDDDEGWTLTTVTANAHNMMNFSCEIPHSKKANASVCNRFPPQTTSFSNTAVEGYCLHQNGNSLYIRISAEKANSVAAFKAWLSANHVELVYELAAPATETAAPFVSPQIVDDFGTEQYVDAGNRDVEIPAGHDTFYRQNLRAKLEMAPNSPESNGDYLMRRSGGQNTYVAYTSPLPAAPSANGAYTLKCTVSGGAATLAWESQ